MLVRVLAFAQAADIAGFRETSINCAAGESARSVVARIAPDLKIDGWRVAVDCEYHDWDSPIGNAQEIAVIPPVSGG